MSGKELKIKICGMKHPRNIAVIAAMMPDYMGFIYYPRSPRYAGDLSPGDLAGLPSEIRKVGVFVNASQEDILSTCRQMGLRSIQLHGGEPPELCGSLKNRGYEVIKAFNLGPDKSLESLEAYLDSCDLFLLDTAGAGFGGTGRQFDWRVLDNYRFEKPFFLSGGIGPKDAGKILKINNPWLFGVDLNSRFEREPGWKNRGELAYFIEEIRARGFW